MTNGKKLGIYVHIPFCVSKCNYCDFCSFVRTDGEKMRLYCAELARRLEKYREACGEYSVDTVYFGGGTPTLLPIACFDTLFGALKENFRISENCEISCECNPATADFEYFRGLRALGVNRLSIGLQSANDSELRILGRAHRFADFVRSFEDARRAGFDNISADVMYGIPEQTADSFARTLERLCELSPEHISSYGLKIEENTPFFKRRAELALPDEDTELKMYLLLTDILAKNGYHKYEISNFSRVGRESKHNLRYWRAEEYLGFGVAAHSYFGGERFGNGRDLSAFLRGEDITEERYALTEREMIEEYVMLRLRLAEGVDENEFFALWGERFEERYPVIKKMADGGFMRRENGRTAFTDRGFFVSSYILSEMLDFD